MSIFLDMDLSISIDGIIAIKYCMSDKFICHIILIKETLVPLNVLLLLLLLLLLLDCLVHS